MSDQFQEHLQRLDSARREAATALEVLPLADQRAEQAAHLAWEMLYDFLCKRRSRLTPELLETAADVFVKFARGHCLLKGSPDSRLAREIRRGAFSEARVAGEAPGLDDETRRGLEREIRAIQ